MKRTQQPRSISRRRLLTLAALGSITLPLRVHGADDELTRLFSELGSRRERHARFVERKFSALLKAPVESSGTLVFRAPDILEKRTIEPQRELVRIEGSIVTYEGAPVRGSTQKRAFALSDAPQLAALIESLRATLAGDLPALRRHYEVSLTAPQGEQGWQLTLVPRDRALRDAVARIVLRGTAGEVGAVEIVEANGDLALLRITPMPALPSAPKK
jgi:hypothetical protein